MAELTDRRAVRRALRGRRRACSTWPARPTCARAPTRCSRPTSSTTRVVLEECLRAGVERVVHTSSVAAVGPAPTGGTADERQLWRGGLGIPYVDAKHEAEVEALRIAARGLPVVIVCPAVVLGAGDVGRSSTEIVRRFMLRRIPAYVEGAINVVDVEDVAAGMLLADERGVPGERYILGNRNYTWDRLFADLARLSGIEPPALRLPVAGGARAGGGARADARRRRRSRRSRCAARRSGGPTARPRRGASWVDDAAARGDGRGDGRVVPRARGRAAGAHRHAPGARAGGWPGSRRGGSGSSCRERGDAAPLPDADELAVPVRARRARAGAARDRVRDRAGGVAGARPRRDRRR